MTQHDYEELFRLERARTHSLLEQRERTQHTADMLARRCAEQARRIGVLMCQDNRRLTVSVEEVIKALRERADDDGALHFDAIREVLIKFGARP